MMSEYEVGDDLEGARRMMKADKDILDASQNSDDHNKSGFGWQIGGEQEEAIEDSTISVSGPPAGDQPPANIWDKLDEAEEEFKEQDHPREDSGKFTSKGGGSTSGEKPTEKRFTLKDYERNENKNAHGTNALKLVQQYGTPEEVKELEGINARHKKEGHLNHDDYKRRYEISQKYYDNLVKDSEKPKEEPKRKLIGNRQGKWYIDSPMKPEHRQNLINDVKERINRLSNPKDKERAQKKIDKVEDMSDEDLSKYFMWMGGRPVGEGRINTDTYYYDYSDYWKKGSNYVRSGLAIQAGIPASWADVEWDDLPADVQAKIRDAGYVTSYESYKEMSWEFLPQEVRQKIGEGLFRKITEADWDGSTQKERKEMLKESGIENDEEEVALLSQLLDNELQEQEEGEDEEEDIAIITQLLAPESEFVEQDHPRADDGQFTSKGGGDSGGKYSKVSDKDIIKQIKGDSKNYHDWGRNEKNEELYAEIERRNQAVPKPKRPEGAGSTIFRDDPDAVKKMEAKIKYLEDVQDYWKKIIKFPARDYHTRPTQLGDAKWFEVTNVGANLRDARKKLEGIKAQQARGTQLVRKPTYKSDQFGKSKPRFYYSEEPKTEESHAKEFDPDADWWGEPEDVSSHLLELQGLKCPDCGKRFEYPEESEAFYSHIDTAHESKKKAKELDDIYNQFTDPINMATGKDIMDSTRGYSNPEVNGQDLTGTTAEEENRLDFSDYDEKKLEDFIAHDFKAEEEIIEKIPPKIKYHYYKQHSFGVRKDSDSPFGNEVSLDTMNQARVWWDNEHPDRPWEDMRIGDRQRVIIAFLRDPNTALEKEPTHISHKNYNIDEYIDDSLQDYLGKSEEQEAPAPPSGNGGEPTNGDMEEDKPTRTAGGIPIGYFASRKCPEGQVYRDGKCRDKSEEGGLGSGKKGHQSWMRAIEEDSDYEECPNCQVITERINGKCQMCGKKW